MKNKRRVITFAAAIAMAASCVGVAAFFSDRVTTSADATAATINIDVTTNWTGATLLPSQKVDLPVTIAPNASANRAMDVRETFIIKSDKAMTSLEKAEWQIYKASDLEQRTDSQGNVITGSYEVKDNAQPIATGANATLDGGTLKYVLPEFVLGAGNDNPNGSVPSKTNNYVVYFKHDADNAYQGAQVTVDYVVEAKQHSGDVAWTTVATKTLTNVDGNKYVPSVTEHADGSAIQ